jgi:hypothetical protein
MTEHGDGQLCQASIRVEIESYAKQRAAHLERGHYMDVAYIDGFVQGLSLLLSDDEEERKSPPAFYVYGAERQPRDARECRKMLARARALDPAAYDYCVDLVKRYRMEEEDIDLHHGPFLEMGP